MYGLKFFQLTLVGRSIAKTITCIPLGQGGLEGPTLPYPMMVQMEQMDNFTTTKHISLQHPVPQAFTSCDSNP